LYLFWLLNGKN